MGIDDPFDYALAARLGRSLAEVRALPNPEVVGWRAYFHWADVHNDHAEKVALMRSRR